MSQIQMEEQEAALRLVQPKKSSSSNGKRYADLASTGSISDQSPTADWVTVGVKGKVMSRSSPKPSPQPTVSSFPVRKSSVAAKPSEEEFMRWCHSSLKGLDPSVNKSEFLAMIASLPLDSTVESVEIIADSIYAASRTMDGRHFAQEFVRRRREIEKTGWSGVVQRGPPTPVGNKKDVWNGQFKVVEGRKKRR